MKLFELINPSDPYTFYAPSIEVAAVVAYALSPWFGATCAQGDSVSSPNFFGWDKWMEERGINDRWIKEHSNEIADAFDSFLIGRANERAEVESMLAALPENKREKWRADRQERHRSSMSAIGERAYALAKQFRKADSGNDSEG